MTRSGGLWVTVVLVVVWVLASVRATESQAGGPRTLFYRVRMEVHTVHDHVAVRRNTGLRDARRSYTKYRLRTPSAVKVTRVDGKASFSAEAVGAIVRHHSVESSEFNVCRKDSRPCEPVKCRAIQYENLTASAPLTGSFNRIGGFLLLRYSSDEGDSGEFISVERPAYSCGGFDFPARSSVCGRGCLTDVSGLYQDRSILPKRVSGRFGEKVFVLSDEIEKTYKTSSAIHESIETTLYATVNITFTVCRRCAEEGDGASVGDNLVSRHSPGLNPT
jgi:hypothetical protein